MLPRSYTYRLFNNTYVPICIYRPTKYIPTYLPTYLSTIYIPIYLCIIYLPTNLAIY